MLSNWDHIAYGHCKNNQTSIMIHSPCLLIFLSSFFSVIQSWSGLSIIIIGPSSHTFFQEERGCRFCEGKEKVLVCGKVLYIWGEVSPKESWEGGGGGVRGRVILWVIKNSTEWGKSFLSPLFLFLRIFEGGVEGVDCSILFRFESFLNSFLIAFQSFVTLCSGGVLFRREKCGAGLDTIGANACGPWRFKDKVELWKYSTQKDIYGATRT